MPETPPTSFRLSADARTQLAALATAEGTTPRYWLERTIRAAYAAQQKETTMDELTLIATARAIYRAHFGHLDDKYFSSKKLGEIEDWLQAGTLPLPPVDQLIAEWGEYDAVEIEANQ